MNKFVIVAMAAVIVLIGDYFSKMWTVTKNTKHVLIAYASYCLVSVLWLCLLNENKDLGKSSVLWIIGGMLASVSLGIFVFGESLSWQNKTGILLSILGIILVSR